MSFDGMVTGSVVRALQKTITGGKIEKIYQPEADEIILNIHAGKEKHKLYISCNSSHARIHLIQETAANPQNPMGFCMLLRKHLQGGRISEIIQRDSERVIEIKIDTINELGYSVNKKLIVEIMGKHSNIILTDVSTGKIIDSIKRISIDVNRYRQLLPGQIYVYPPTQEKVPYYSITKEQISNLLFSNPGSTSKALVGGIQGISPLIGNEFADLSSEQVFIKLNRYVSQITDNQVTPKVYLNEDQTPVEFHCFPIESLSQHYEELAFSDINQALDYYYSHKDSSNRIKQKSSDLYRAISSSLDKLYLKKQRLSEDLLQAENSDGFRLFGELLTANLHLLKSGVSVATVLNYYDNTTIEIPLDPKYSPIQNAQRYYKKYGKSKTAIKEKTIQLEETETDISYLESVLSYVEKAASIEELEELRQEMIEGGYLKRRKNNFKPSKSKPMPHQYTTSDGFRILVGRNNKENDILTFKTASGKDIWFHTKDIPGSHVILFLDGNPITETAIFETASIAAYHSKGKESENVPVDYTQVRHVKKPSGAKPGMVIFTDNKTIYVHPRLP